MLYKNKIAYKPTESSEWTANVDINPKSKTPFSEYLYFLTFLGLICLALLAIFSLVEASEPPYTIPAEQTLVQPVSSLPEPCYLSTVTCDNEIYATISQYSKVETCPTTVCITASGTTPARHRTVACPRYLKLGTRVAIAGQEYICEDRTAYTNYQGRKVEGRFDIYAGDTQRDYEAALRFGVKELEVVVYEAT